MKISQLMRELAQALSRHGDVEVCIEDVGEPITIKRVHYDERYGAVIIEGDGWYD